VNAWIDDHTWQGINHRNWGDDINYYFIRELTHRPVVTLFNFRLARKFRFKNYLCIGSLLGMPDYANENTIVWGAGSFGELKGISPNHICSVRGKLTRDILREKGIECPEIYGDPALLLPLVYKPFNDLCKAPKERVKRVKSEKEENNYSHENGRAEFQVSSSNMDSQQGKASYKLGIIPHIVDLEHPIVEQIRREHPEILIINLANYEKWTDVIDEICSCERILSSSLHGLIVSDAYGIPNCWIELSGKILGGYFKYRDYGSSVNRDFSNPIRVEKTADVADLADYADSFSSCADAEKIEQLQKGLLSVAPFQCKVSCMYN